VSARSIALAALGAGIAAGAAIGALSRAVESSRIALGPYALYGNGALAIPGILGPVATFAGWIVLMRLMRAAAIPMTAYLVGLDLGGGLGYAVLAGQGVFPPMIVMGFGIFLIPTAAIAALTIWVLRRTGLASSATALAVAFVGSAVLFAIPPLAFFGGFAGSGIPVGAGLTASRNASSAAAALVGIAVALLAIVQVFALPIIAAPLLAPR
jgi:hypothetical protein